MKNQKRIQRFRIFALSLLSLLFTACRSGDVAPEFSLTEETHLPITTPSPITATPTIRITQSPSKTPEPLVLVTQTPVSFGIQLILSEQSLAKISIPARSFDGVKEEVFFASGFGGGPPYECFLPLDFTLPVIGYNQDPFQKTTQLCLLGFPEDSPVEVELYAPSGEFVTSQQFTEFWGWERDFKLEEQNGKIRAEGGYVDIAGEYGKDALVEVSLMNIPLWFPVGTPTGEWRVVAKSGDISIEGLIPLDYLDESISVLPSLVIDPFEMNSCHNVYYSVGDTVYITGAKFPPNKEIPIGLYVHTGESVMDGEYRSNFAYGVKIFGTLVKTSSQGDFLFAYEIEPDNPDGNVYIIPNDQITVMYWDTCFTVTNENGRFPEWTPEFRDIRDYCLTTAPPRLKIGGFATVSLIPPDPNTVRAGAGKIENRLGVILPGERIEILDGPKCADGWYWWKIVSTKTGLEGWTAEGDSRSYWIVPEDETN